MSAKVKVVSPIRLMCSGCQKYTDVEGCACSIPDFPRAMNVSVYAVNGDGRVYDEIILHSNGDIEFGNYIGLATHVYIDRYDEKELFERIKKKIYRGNIGNNFDLSLPVKFP